MLSLALIVSFVRVTDENWLIDTEIMKPFRYGGHPINRENCLLFCKTLPLIGVYYFHLKGKHLVSLQNKFLACCQGSKPVLESFGDIQCVFLEESKRHCIFL